MLTRARFALLSAATALLGTFVSFTPQVGLADDDSALRQQPARRGAPPTAMHVQEWGVETRRWDGGSEAGVVPDDVPAYCHDALKLPLAAPRPQRPDQQIPDGGPARPRKPVIYVSCEKDTVFDLDVTIASGQLTWLYPKPTRMTSRSAAQWDNIQLVNANSPYWKTPGEKPQLPTIADDHWASYSREGSSASLVANGEVERYLFYEAENRSLPELDVIKTNDGHIEIRNFATHAQHDVRFHQPAGDAIEAWYIKEIAAGSEWRPTVVRLDIGQRVKFDEYSKTGVLADETKAAGLTEPQAKVFARAWHSLFFRKAEATLSWRRDVATLNALMPLKFTTKPDVAIGSLQRVGYVYVHGIDFTQQSQFDQLAMLAIGGNAEARTKLQAGGMAAATALRTILASRDRSIHPELLKHAEVLLRKMVTGE
ncbi:MAG: hypothetical protein AB7K09_01210 [Planctomycetota bacterium]